VEELGFAVLHNEASVDKNFGHNIIATEKKGKR